MENVQPTYEELLAKIKRYEAQETFLRSAVQQIDSLYAEVTASQAELEKKNRELEREIAERKRIDAQLQEANKKLHEKIEEVRQLSNTDGLTGLANRRCFEEVFVEEWNRALRFGEQLSLILIDLDYFKNYNDTYGHQEGDECLKKVAGAMKKAFCRAGELVARYGGEEFVALLPGLGIDDAEKSAEALREKVKGLCIPHGSSKVCPEVSLSMGVASVFPEQKHNRKDLIECADKALYEAKAEGRDRIKVFT